ncbi:winged helix-turn-helix transcriptional regulator [Candidatus Saccharibacteria bacterium]|nr:winged helix-turn-helix transcriptional regulator [Candidatus Saccharibacteria bacterium]
MDAVNTVEILKSLADDTRLSLVRKLHREGCEVASNELVSGCSEVLKLAQPTLSHHVNRLVQVGLLIPRKVGTEKFYKLNNELLISIGIDAAKL